MSELWRKGAVELAALIRDREVSSREVIQAHLDRIEAVNPALNAIIRLLPDEALAAADAADRAVADGTTLGPLLGAAGGALGGAVAADHPRKPRPARSWAAGLFVRS